METSRRRTVSWIGSTIIAGIGLPCMRLAHAKDGPRAADPFEGDPMKSHQWPAMKREFLGTERVVFDERVRVRGPKFADDAMNVPISIDATDLPGIERVVVLVDRNPIRKVLEFAPVSAMPSLSFRFKLEQASPVRVAARTADGTWHVGGTWVEAAGGGCTLPGNARADDSWQRTLGQVQARLFERDAEQATGPAGTTRLRVRVMHPMDTGLVSGIPAFYLKNLVLVDGRGQALLRLLTFEPVSENPVFSFDFRSPPPGPLKLTGMDNNGNRVAAEVGG